MKAWFKTAIAIAVDLEKQYDVASHHKANLFLPQKILDKKYPKFCKMLKKQCFPLLVNNIKQNIGPLK